MALFYYNHYYCLFFFFFFLLVLARSHEPIIHNQDLHSFISFKASADPSNSSLNTWAGSNPCSGSWAGVKCNGGRVVSIYLDDAFLVGNVAPLLCLSHLQVLSLRRNDLSGSLPHLSNLTNPRLKHLFLSHNRFSGALNISLPYLLSLRVENNSFSGGLEGLLVPAATNFNVSVNRLSGEIYPQFLRFPVSAFVGNPALCGSLLPSCVKNTQVSIASNYTAEISSSSTSSVGDAYSRTSLAKLGVGTVLAIIIGNIVVISTALVIVIGIYIRFSRKNAVSLTGSGSVQGLQSDHVFSEEEENKKKDKGLVCFEGGEDLRLECLLKSSAEVLGKGSTGSTYKAVLDDGLVVAVKRLSNVRFPSFSKGFNRQLNLMGRLRHSNVVSLRAYCNAREEKLLVYDHMPNGSLHSLLYNTGRGSIRGRGLDWKSRKHILMGAAQGLHFIHSFPSRPPLVHANIKPSNIFIDEHGNGCISEWGLMVFARNTCQVSPLHSSTVFSSKMEYATTSAWHGYRAPELLTRKEKATQESDVYSFGMVLLELVTDKEMDDEASEGETMRMVKIGVMCTQECPHERPKMDQVVSMIGELL